MINNIINKFGANYKQKNKELWYQCPFHGGKSYSSFSVNKLTGFYKCFKCGATGIVKNETKINIKKIIKEQKQEKKELPYKLDISIDAYNNFKKYIKHRKIDINLDEFDNFNFMKNKALHGLIINNQACYCYYLDNNCKILKKDDGANHKLWMYNSIPVSFYFNHKSFINLENLYIFESLEDSLAFIELFNIDYSNSKFCILFGVQNIARMNFKYFNNINIYFCLDNDKAGNLVLEKYKNILPNLYYFDILEKNNIKDYNDLLIKNKKNHFF